jgi:peptidyl-prolyl cis-trans isomerase B (cyclophilin B)
MKYMLTLVFLCVAFSFSVHAQAKKTKVTKSTASKKVVATKGAVKKVAVKKPVAELTNQPVRIKITTDSGVMIVKLYDSTPLHRDNFIKLVQAGFYDSLMFHRVIAGFMIQGGDPQSKNAASGVMLGNGGGDMARIPAEFRPALRHKRGALAAARDGNPEKASSACQFYIVQGKKLSDGELDMLQNRKGFTYTPAERELYKTQGGTAMLDMEYTVFGEVESGLEVIDKIATVAKDAMNRPLGDIRMHMEIMNLNKQIK